jgi:hypothetical protein
MNLSAVGVMKGSCGFLSAHRGLKGTADQLIRGPRCFLRTLKGGSDVNFDLVPTIVHHLHLERRGNDPAVVDGAIRLQ